jgi:hypothetical protein
MSVAQSAASPTNQPELTRIRPHKRKRPPLQCGAKNTGAALTHTLAGPAQPVCRKDMSTVIQQLEDDALTESVQATPSSRPPRLVGGPSTSASSEVSKGHAGLERAAKGDKVHGEETVVPAGTDGGAADTGSQPGEKSNDGAEAIADSRQSKRGRKGRCFPYGNYSRCLSHMLVPDAGPRHPLYSSTPNGNL